MSDPGEQGENIRADKPETFEKVRQQLSRILASRPFRRSKVLTTLLRFVVEEALAGRASRLKARSIAVRALGRPIEFDTRTDPIVSIQAGRLRRALGRYYEDEGRDDPVLISIPVGRYVPTFAPGGQQDTLPVMREMRHQRTLFGTQPWQRGSVRCWWVRWFRKAVEPDILRMLQQRNVLWDRFRRSRWQVPTAG